MAYNKEVKRQNSSASKETLQIDIDLFASKETEIPKSSLQKPSLTQSGTSLKTLTDLEGEKEIEVDGGYGWFVVIGSFIIQMFGFGVISSWGVMQDYYQQTIFKDDKSASVNLSLVGVLAGIFSYALSPITQVITSIISFRAVMLIGALLMLVSMELAGLSTKVWHLYITQGVFYGAGLSFMYANSMSVVPQWFNKKRGIALAVTSAGSGLGGLSIPFIYTTINSQLGAGWTYRIMGFVSFFFCFISFILVKERVPRQRRKFSQIIEWRILKNINFLLYTLGSDIVLASHYIPFFFLPSYATYLGFPTYQGSSLISILCATNFFGRICFGIMADRIGHLNMNIIYTLISSFSVFFLWKFAYSYSMLVGFSVVYGFSSGSYSSAVSNVTANLLSIELLPSGISFLFVTNAISFLGVNIASAIDAHVSGEPYITFKLVTGACCFVGSVVLTIVKLKINKNFLAKV
ncbi:major facilitator superfamily domain-containing protein [Sporodiniella umbellata]|nr:major facilitator superfamily domain-containing protein [Sporodiniella umbellata]